MSKMQTLRAAVTERLTAAAEDIFVLFERTIAEYEEELCLFKEENQRKQRLLDMVCNPGVQAPSSPTPGPSQNRDITGIKPEPEELKEEPRTGFVLETSTVCVKIEESSLLQRQPEHREETQEDISSEPHLHSDTEEHTDDWTCPWSFPVIGSSWSESSMKPEPDRGNYNQAQTRVVTSSCSDSPMEAAARTPADGSDYNQVQTRYRSTAAQKSGLSSEHKSAPETSATVNKRDKTGTEGSEKKKYQCSVCQKRLVSKQGLQIHSRLHSGERPYHCSICEKAFNQKCSLKQHKRVHTGERPFKCKICEKTFSRKCNLEMHRLIHTGERPFTCFICEKTFSQKVYLKLHMRIHTKEKPYSCSFCNKTFVSKGQLNAHRRTHTGEQPYSCSLCPCKFTWTSGLQRHMRSHEESELNS